MRGGIESKGPAQPCLAARGLTVYLYILIGGFVFVFLCYEAFGPSHRLTQDSSSDQLGLQGASYSVSMITGRVVRRDGVTITYPEVVQSIDEWSMRYDNLLSVIKRWNPDNPDPPASFTETLQHFNYSCPAERAVAAQFLEAEMPFKLYGVPEFDAISKKWTDEYVIEGLKDKNVHRNVEIAEKNHFMFYHGSGRGVQDWTPPQRKAHLTAADFFKIAHDADASKLSSEATHHYMTVGVGRLDEVTFIGRDLSLFSTTTDNFFVRHVDKNKGIQCRFGMRGVTAASHYDSGRNMVAVLRGRRRYVLNPPTACKRLSIYSQRNHPSFRHSAIDWSSIEEGYLSGFGEADAIDTIIHAGEVLYIPSYWFHYIVSIEYSAQCNTRHGPPPDGFGKHDIDECFRQYGYKNSA